MRPADPDRAARRGIWIFASLLIPAAAVIVWRESWWPHLLFAAWTLAAAAFYVTLEKRRMRARNIRMLESAKASAIRTLSHHRHDWMNDLQILYGYLRLNKPDKAVEVVDRIRERMENDSRVSGLGNTELSAYLLSFRTISEHMKLEVKVADGLSLDRLPLDAEPLVASLIGLINAVRYRAAAQGSGENVLRLSLYRTEQALHAELDYEGHWASGRNWAEEAERLLRGWGYLAEQEGIGDPGGSSSWRMLITFPLTVRASDSADPGLSPPDRS